MVMPYNTSENYYNVYILILLQQVLSEFPSDSHSVIKPVTVPVARVLHYVSNKFKVSTAFRFQVYFNRARHRETDRQTGCNKCMYMASQINIYSQLVISLIRISDITNLN